MQGVERHPKEVMNILLNNPTYVLEGGQGSYLCDPRFTGSKGIRFTGKVVSRMTNHRRNIILTRKEMKVFQIVFIFDTGNYIPDGQYEVESVKEYSEQFLKKVFDNRYELRQSLQETALGKKKNNYSFLYYLYDNGVSTLLFIDNEGKEYHLGEPDINQIINRAHLTKSLDLQYQSGEEGVGMFMNQIYSTEIEADGNYIAFENRDTLEEMDWISVVMFFKKSVREQIYQKLKKKMLVNIKILIDN